MLVLHHVTYSINSLCHFFGRRPFDTGDHSRNLAWLGPLSMGESWHNNHHAFPTSARHGLRWWQIDISAGVIRLLEIVRPGVGREPRAAPSASWPRRARAPSAAPGRARARPTA